MKRTYWSAFFETVDICACYYNLILKLYLDNAKRLKELNVSQVKLLNFPTYDTYRCGIYRNSQGQIICIEKCYTDGQIYYVEPEHIVDELFNYSGISFSVDNQDKTQSFILNANNNEHGYQYRGIEIRNFGFDASKLPSEEDIRSYEIPKYLTKK